MIRIILYEVVSYCFWHPWALHPTRSGPPGVAPNGFSTLGRCAQCFVDLQALHQTRQAMVIS